MTSIGDMTVTAALLFLLSAGTIAILLSRVPGWDKVPANVKKVIVGALNVATPFLLTLLQVYVPPDVGNQTVTQALIGLLMWAASFVIHLLDEWLASAKAVKEVEAVKAKQKIAPQVGSALAETTKSQYPERPRKQ